MRSGKFAAVKECITGILNLPKVAVQARLHIGG
jgi:hypothetical protein